MKYISLLFRLTFVSVIIVLVYVAVAPKVILMAWQDVITKWRKEK